LNPYLFSNRLDQEQSAKNMDAGPIGKVHNGKKKEKRKAQMKRRNEEAEGGGAKEVERKRSGKMEGGG
jgi:hypothetical protein